MKNPTALIKSGLVACIIAAGTVSVAPASLAGHHESGEMTVYEKREKVMKALGGVAKSVGGMLRGAEPFDLAKAQEGGKLVQKKAAMIEAVFPAGSNEGDSEALPIIWEDWDGFLSVAKELEERGGALAAAGDQAAVGAAFGDMLKSCGGCHKKYRVQKD